MNHRLYATPTGAWLALLAALCLGLTACGGGGGAPLTSNDMDGDGTPDHLDNDLDGDGLRNQYDPDVDNDGVQNWDDDDADDDGTPNAQDPTPYGPHIPTAQTLLISAGVATVSFGDVAAGQMAGPASITIENDTTSMVTVERVELVGSGGGAYTIDTSTLTAGDFTLTPGQTAEFTASYLARSGQSALGRVEVGIRTGGVPATAVVNLLGQGTAPALMASGAPSTINFGDVPTGITAGPAVATIVNDTGGALDITRIELTGTGGGTFALDVGPLPGGSVPFTLPPGDRAVFHVTYTPLQGVPSVGEVLVDLSDGGGTTTLGLDLLGQGIAPSILVSPNDVDYGAALAGVEAIDLTVEVGNAYFANGNLTVTTIDFPQDSGGEFSLAADPTPFTVTPGGAPVVITVRFRPQAGSTGVRSGRMRIHGDDPTAMVEYNVDLVGRAAAWRPPDTVMATDLTVAAGSDAAEPVWLAGTTTVVLRSAGPDGTWGGALFSDDEIVVIDADPDNDPATLDARIIVRWAGFPLSPAPAGAPVDAGNGRHIFFLEGGVDGVLGTGDDNLRVLDTVSGSTRTRACPTAGERKSRPVIVDPGSSRVVVATGVGGGLLGSADTLLVYENLLGDLSSNTPSATISLEIVVPDLLCATPVVMSGNTVVMPVADATDSPDLTDRALNDGNEGLVQVRGLGGSAVVERVELSRALTEVASPADGDVFCRAVRLDATSLLVGTEGADPANAADDEVVRLDGVGSAAFAIGASLGVADLSGAGSQPVSLGAGFLAFASPSTDGVYGTSDDELFRLDTGGGMAATAFGPGAALAGDGGSGTGPIPFGTDVIVATAGPNGTLGDSDDTLLQLDVTTTGAPSVLATLPVPGGLFGGSRTTARSLSGALVLDDRFVAVADRGPDNAEGTADDVLRIYRDLDGNGRLGESADDLGLDGSFDAADSFQLPLPLADGDHTPLAAGPDGHLVTVAPGSDGALGSGTDDVPVMWWLLDSATLR